MNQLSLFGGVKVGTINVLAASSGTGKSVIGKTKVQMLEEITDWDFPNHTYYIDPKSKRMIAYKNVNTGAMHHFTGKGLSFDRRNRKFKPVKWRYI